MLLYSYMATVGYLRAVPTDMTDGSGRMLYRLSIPNRDVSKAVYDEMEKVHPLSYRCTEYFNRAVSEGNEKEVEESLAWMMDKTAFASFGDCAWRIMALEIAQMLSKRYETNVEAPPEEGWIGISFTPKAQGLPGIILALDTADGMKDPDAEMAEALGRMSNRERPKDMEGRVILIGMAFWNKVPRIEVGSVMNGDGFALCDKKAGRT